ncbi:NAD(P)H-dependent flavin oxidoreductase [Legionella fallonii]|uniref:Nitronate monooxygenase n=1 Tax=Legionella fallonii LLAP-10 TaxID=1212491 RepID=A0A098G2B5_9GAMM|nr:nitronate monooxygenase [Legionella fallonii]CEG56109.1 putative nitronate monooxygenase [Legionella fallonii LLAP-10]
MPSPLLQSTLNTQLGLKWPLIQAPMAGGPSTPEFAAAASNARVLGSLGLAYLPPAEVEKTIKRTQTLTQRPFAVNLFAPAIMPVLNKKKIDAALAATRLYRKELVLPDPLVHPPFNESFEEQIVAVIKCKPAVFSFTFGLVDKNIIKECHQHHIITIGTATSVEEGMALEESGVDAVVAQGAEAGGHSAMFLTKHPNQLLGTLALTRMMALALRIPVIASGGIMDGQGIAAALTLGAQAVQLGTAFLLCDEAGTSPAYRETLDHAQGNQTRFTRAFSGRWARGIKNRFMEEMERRENDILPFPAQNAFTRDMRKKATELGKAEFLSLWAGQAVNLIRKMTTEELVQTLYGETVHALQER